MQYAYFKTVKDAYNLESEQLLLYGYTFSRKAVYPTDIEKQNVKLALQVFSESGPNALRVIGAKHNLKHHEETASFIDVIVRWWKVVNVKTPFKGLRLRDDLQKPVCPSPFDPRVSFLNDFLDWLEEWKERRADACKLSDETHGALIQTTRAFIEICAYCFDELKMSFVLLGKFQTDLLEDRFGCYRRLAGSQYHLSVRQIYECENKLRLQSTLPQISTASAVDNDQNQNWEEVQTQAAVPSGKFNVVVTQEALSKLKDVIPVIAYVAGYSVHIAVKRLKCDECKQLLTIDKTVSVSPENHMYSLVKEIDRGGLVYPAMPAVNAVAHNYVVVEELSKCAEFLKVQNQRQVATELTLQLLSDEEPSDFDVCEKGHPSEVVLKYILWCSTNVLLKNFCRRLNN
ncbi:hypothetical protein HPB48_009423 [Haemaphysalis longicornis]|uniref:Transposable element P transposase-like GTP-binding insertion domain-containing protein n=1 Tax=Haemaphysalis longicornis TaxID=44386 RepID=A0A9J6GJU0_HAELO|nr:hypothetical protein HPB48_009423 [Haemaphysalis longicornis]